MKACEERTASKKALGSKSRAATVDLGNTSRQGVFLSDLEAPSPVLSPRSPGTPLDAVFEEEETEGTPLISGKVSEKPRILEKTRSDEDSEKIGTHEDSEKRKDSEKIQTRGDSQKSGKHSKLKKQYAMDEIPLKSVKSLPDP